MLECVINVSEGRNGEVLSQLDRAGGPSLRDRHSDPWHHRSVYTLINDAALLVPDVQRLVSRALELIDLGQHLGVHPRLGVVDVVPFVPWTGATLAEAVTLRDELGRWLSEVHGLASFLYGPLGSGERTLPEVRRRAYHDLSPDFGPLTKNPRSGAACLGARDILIAWNIWISGVDIAVVSDIAATLRRPGLRTLGLEVGEFLQVSCNITDWRLVSAADIYDQVRHELAGRGVIERAELVGLAPAAFVASHQRARWAQLDFDDHTTIEGRLERSTTEPRDD